LGLHIQEELVNDSTMLQQEVRQELAWEPSMNASHLDVEVSEPGVVTLTGTVATYPEKVIAEQTTKRVPGVRAVANLIEVQPIGSRMRNDTDLAQAVLRALEWDIAVPHEKISASVHDGWVTLEGEMALPFQRTAAENTVRRLSGVRGVNNQIVLEIGRAPVQLAEVKQRIEAALRRSAEIDARRIEVKVLDSRIILRGMVRTWAEREDAEQAAWGAPGVVSVKDELVVGT
jgi:osmotically-inducible protein OsmY